jgi:2-polyprenyl-3-methyl-5-hydroxy-6-metoxy-1,4-benzoquinol methylase
MAFAFHSDPELYFTHQYEHARDFVLPYIRQSLPVGEGMEVLEIGCGEGGVLKAFLEVGCICLGIDLSQDKIAHGKKLLSAPISEGKMAFMANDIYEVETEKLLNGRFDLILLKDTIEHIFDQEKIIRQMKAFLRPGGMIFYGYPPWYMPFGGHQQITRSKLLSRLPWYHLLPSPLYRMILKAFGEAPECVKE